ncbi:hypothetical protein BDR26DRAFT_340635 [Obelidium mucronatum]|nr:hypothetical protein BDR26DRAFT_340635 [Obelidium mucronatum]
MTDDTHTDYEVITKRRRTTYESGAVGTTPRLPKGATKQTAENVYDKEASIEEEEEEVLEEGPALRMPQLAALSDGEGYSAQVKGCNPFTKTNPRFTKCKPCISKIGKGDTCRFVNFRLYRVSAPDSGPWFYPSPIDIVSKDSDFRGRGFDQHFEAKLDVAGKRPTQTLALNIPNRHVLKTTNADELYILKTTAGVLQGIIDHELIVLGYTKTGEKKANGSQLLEPFYRPPSKDSAVVVRQLCDECLTSIFNTYYSCSHCARELCAACYETLKDTVHEAAASVLANQSKPWRAFLSCGLIRSGIFHCKSQFLIMSKLTLQELIGMRKCTEIVLQKFQG